MTDAAGLLPQVVSFGKQTSLGQNQRQMMNCI
jgi:hypothetical protein